MAIGTFEATCRGLRALLNLPPHHSTGAIVAEIEDTRGWAEDECRGHRIGKRAEQNESAEYDAPWELTPEYTLQISDCDRSISFGVDFLTEKERRNSLYKVETMIAALTQFRDALVDEQRLYVERVERFKAREPDQAG